MITSSNEPTTLRHVDESESLQVGLPKEEFAESSGMLKHTLDFYSIFSKFNIIAKQLDSTPVDNTGTECLLPSTECTLVLDLVG